MERRGFKGVKKWTIMGSLNDPKSNSQKVVTPRNARQKLKEMLENEVFKEVTK